MTKRHKNKKTGRKTKRPRQSSNDERKVSIICLTLTYLPFIIAAILVVLFW